MKPEEVKEKFAELIEVGLGNTPEELAEYIDKKAKQNTILHYQMMIEELKEENKSFSVSQLSVNVYFLNRNNEKIKQYEQIIKQLQDEK